MAVDRTDTDYAAEGSVFGYGTQFLVGDGASPEGFDAVAAVKSISFPATEFADRDTTHLRSLNRHKEHSAGMRDTSAITITGIYMPDEWSHSTAGGGAGAFASGGLPVLAADGELRNFVVRLPHGSPEVEVEIRGYIAAFHLNDVDTETTVEYTLTIQPSQAFTLP